MTKTAIALLAVAALASIAMVCGAADTSVKSKATSQPASAAASAPATSQPDNSPAAAFVGVKEIRLVRGDVGNPKSRTVIVKDAAEVKEFVAAIQLTAKEPCLCDHSDSAVFVTDKGQTTVSLCDHCFDFGGKAYRMPAKFYKLYTAKMGAN